MRHDRAQDLKPAEAPPAKPDTRTTGTKDKDPAGDTSPGWSSSSARIPHGPRRPRTGSRLHLIDVETGEVTLIADEPSEGLVRIGSPSWSHDGRRILFDAMPEDQVASRRSR